MSLGVFMKAILIKLGKKGSETKLGQRWVSVRQIVCVEANKYRQFFEILILEK